MRTRELNWLEKAAQTERAKPRSVQRRGSAALVEKLLDAAFHELQHDTGEHDPEWRYQREKLKAAFNRILRVRHNVELSGQPPKT